MSSNDVRLTAARARARREVLGDERTVLGVLEPSLWRLAEADGTVILAVAEDLQLHGADLVGLALSRLSEGQAKVLLALLVATRSTALNSMHPYPGVAAAVDDALIVLGGPRLGKQAEAHVKGALNKLHGWRLAQLGEDGADPVSAELGVSVRLGPAVALWSGPWVGELMALVDRVAEERGWPR